MLLVILNHRAPLVVGEHEAEQSTLAKGGREVSVAEFFRLVGLLVVVGGLVGLFVVVGGLVVLLVVDLLVVVGLPVVVGGGLVGLLVVVVLCVGLEAINGRRVVVVCLALGPPLTFVLINDHQNIEI